jgi:hypothetical protein
MERLKEIQEKLIDCAHCQVSEHMEEVDTCELGEVIDMIKDISEAMYYWTVTEAMEKKEEYSEKEKHRNCQHLH